MNKWKFSCIVLLTFFLFEKNSIAAPLEVQNYNKTVSKKMVKAFNEGKLIVPQYISMYIFEMAKNGYCKINNKKAYLSPQLLNLINRLITSKTISKSKPLSILSMFRLGSNNHAKLEKNNQYVCRAIDIDNYAGYRINIVNPTSSLNAIVKLIGDLPQGRFNLGLPRPGGGDKIDPKTDYFLPVTNIKQNQVSPTGTLAGDLKLIKSEKARKALTEAINKNKKAQILYFMPDATDHLHIKAIDKDKLQ